MNIQLRNLKTLAPRIERLIIRGVLIAGLLMVVGCVTGGRDFDESKVTQIKKGQTTEADLVGLFGQAQHRTASSDGTTSLTWTYFQSKAKGTSFIPIAGAFMGGSDQKSKSLMVILGSEGKVIDYTSSGGGIETRTIQ